MESSWVDLGRVWSIYVYMVPGVSPVGLIRWSISIMGSWSFSSRSRLPGVFPAESWTGVYPVVFNSFSSAWLIKKK